MNKPARFIPSSYTLIHRDEKHAVEVWGTTEPRVIAMLYGGKRSKPDWHFRFQSAERMWAQIDRSINGMDAHAKMKAEWKAKRTAPHDVKVGDIFRSSWGYDQTNIDFYEVTRLIGKSTVEVRPIAQDSMETLSMQGECVPLRGQYIGEARQHRVSMAGGEPSIAVRSFANAYRMKPVAVVAGVPMFQSSHWTAYA